MEKIDAAEATAWLRPGDPDGIGEVIAYFTPGWPARLAILHPIYREPAGEQDDSFDDHPYYVHDLQQALDRGWQRISWREFFGPTGWPTEPAEVRSPHIWRVTEASGAEDIVDPFDGQLDRTGYLRLGQILAEHTAGGADAPCVFYWSLLATHFPEGSVARAGTLGELDDTYDRPDTRYSPSNIWPADHSWLLSSDCDFKSTILSGPLELIEAVEADDFLETVRTNWPER